MAPRQPDHVPTTACVDWPEDAKALTQDVTAGFAVMRRVGVERHRRWTTAANARVRLEPDSPEQMPGESVGCPIDLPSDNPPGVVARSLACGLGIAQVSCSSVELTAE